MKFVVVETEKMIDEFLNGVNAAFKDRSGDFIPYEPLEKEKITQDNIENFCLIDESNKMIGGLSLKTANEKGKTGLISHVWVHPDEQHRGIGKKLLENTEKYCVDNGYASMTLGVSNIYKPAYNLYKNYGFKKYKIYANVPNTYYFVGMIKYLEAKENSFARSINYIISKIKFSLLFKKDSTPNLLHKIIFRKG